MDEKHSLCSGLQVNWQDETRELSSRPGGRKREESNVLITWSQSGVESAAAARSRAQRERRADLMQLRTQQQLSGGRQTEDDRGQTMRNHSRTLPTEASASPAFNASMDPSSNRTSSPPSAGPPSPSPSSELQQQIWANDITSRANYVYCVFAVLGLAAGCFLLYGFARTSRARRRPTRLHRLLAAFCGLQLLLLLLSLHMVLTRPGYLRTTVLGCVAFYWAVDAASLCVLLVLVLMAGALALDGPPAALLGKPWLCATLVALTSSVVSLLLAGLRRPRAALQDTADCFTGPVSLSYGATRLVLAVLVPYALQFGLLARGLVRQWRAGGGFLSGSEDGPVYMAVSLLLFSCHLFYSAVLVGSAPTPYGRALVSVAEFVLYLGSSCSLLLTLVVHGPCRENLSAVLGQLRGCCQNPGRSQPNSNIIAPHIEISDTLQDIED